MIVYQAVRAGAYGVVLDPSGPLAALAGLPEFRDIARVYALTGRDSRAGALNPYRVITDPRRDDPEYNARNVEYARDADPFAGGSVEVRCGYACRPPPSASRSPSRCSR